MEIKEMRFSQPNDVESAVQLLDVYSRTHEGGATPLPDDIKSRLLRDLPKWGNSIAFVARHETRLAGIVLGFCSMYVFAARPCANIQFLFVNPDFQRQGLGKQLMLSFERKARELDCCKVNLEVRESNTPAKALYQQLAYSQGRFGPQNDLLEFWEKEFC